MAACSAAAADDAAGYDDDSVSAPRARCFSVGAIAISEERNEMRTRASDFLLDYLYGGSSSAAAAAAAQRSDDGNDDGDREEQRGIERSSAQPRKVFDVAPSLLLPPETTVRRSRSGRSGRSRGPRDGRTDGRPMHPSLNPSLSRSSRFFTRKCDRRSCLVGRGSHTESNGALWHRRRREEKWFLRLIYNPSPIKILPHIRLKSHL